MVASILRDIIKVFRHNTAQGDASTAQLLRDAGITVEPGLLGPTVKSVDQPPMMQSQAVAVQSALELLAYPETRDGNGVFGQWKLDSDKLPAYLYELENRRSRLAYFVNSQGLD